MARDCLEMAPPGTWTKIQSPGEDIVKLFDSTATDSTVLWFKNGEAKFGMCHSCSTISDYARSFQIADAKPKKIEKLVEQECIR